MTLDSYMIDFNESKVTNQIKSSSELNDLDPSKLFFVGYQPKVSNSYCYENSQNMDNDYDEDEGHDEIDELECDLLHENFSLLGGGGGGGGGNFSTSSSINHTILNKKMNISTRIENDIIRSEKKSEKRVNYQGRDDRATSEQVMDPRTRLMLFKLLSSGFLSEIDGMYYVH